MYLLTKPADPAWDIPIEQSDSELWYVGMTAGNLFERMVTHFGPRRTESSVLYQHRWTNNSAPPHIEERLAHGDVVVYPIEVDSALPQLTEKERSLLPSLVEKQLLIAYVDRYRKLPPLNLSM